MADGPYRSIGEVVEALSEEFDDLTISKVRFLESKGVLDPERTPSGYRRYRDRDVAQLRWVLRQQRDHFLPLKVIRERLRTEALDFEEADEAAPTAQPLPRVDAMVPPDRDLELTGKELSERSGISVAHLADMERFGLLSPRIRRGRPVYGGDDLVAARLVARFLTHGIEPRHLRPFKVAAEREAGLIDQRLSGVASATQRAELLADLLRLGEDLRSLLLRQLVHPTDS